MKHENQSGYIPHLGPVTNNKPPRLYRKSALANIKGIVESVREHVIETIKSLFVYKADVVILNGMEKRSGETCRVLYFGFGVNQAYLSDLFFSEYEATTKVSDVNPWRSRYWCAKYGENVDLVIFDLPWPACRLIRDNGYIALAPWINMVIPLGNAWDDVVGRWAKNVKSTDLRQIRKHKLNFRIINSAQDFRDFYHDYYVPYVTVRFGDSAYIENDETVVAVHKYGEIIQILRGDTVIAAAVLIDSDGSFGFHWIGVPVTVDPLQNDGGFVALYYFITRLAYERGCKEVDCFTSRPTLSDGVLRFKRKWGARLSGCDKFNGQIMLKPIGNHRAVTSFIAGNPLITQIDGGFVAKHLFEGQTVSAMQMRETLDKYYTEGLSELRLYSMSGFAQDVEEVLRERNINAQLFDLSKCENPLQSYSCSCS